MPLLHEIQILPLDSLEGVFTKLYPIEKSIIIAISALHQATNNSTMDLEYDHHHDETFHDAFNGQEGEGDKRPMLQHDFDYASSSKKMRGDDDISNVVSYEGGDDNEEVSVVAVRSLLYHPH